MKKTIILILALSITLAVFGLVSIMGGNSKSEAINTIGTDRAKEIAFEKSGYTPNDAREISVEFEKSHGLDIYEVEFEINGLDYDYFIDAYTGAIIESKVPPVKDQATAMANNQGNQQNDQAGSQQAQQTNQTGSQQGSQQTNQTGSQQGSQQTNQAGSQQGSQQTNQAGSQQGSQQTNQTGSQQGSQQTNQAGNQQSTQAQSTAPSGIISEAQAKNLVLARVPGATAANFTKFNLDFDDGRYEYEGELIFNEMEYDFEIDAYSGSFRDWDAESIYD